MKWVKRWGYMMSDKPVRPGVYRLKDGGHFVRGKLTDPATKRPKEITAVLRHATKPSDAERELEKLVAAERAELTGEILESPPWSDFAVSVLEERIRKKDIESDSTIDRWKEALRVLIPVFGHRAAAEVRRVHIDRWINGQLATWMTDGKPSKRKRRVKGELVEVNYVTKIKPTTANGWLRILKTISNAARLKFELVKSAFDGIEFFKEGRIYTREAPNSLPPDVAARFLEIARAKYPQHYAMMVLGFATGLRPSSMRPIRHKGPEPDIDWKTGLLIIRRSHSRRQKAMDKTKTGKDSEIYLPPALLDLLRWHVAALPKTDSDLLFPGRGGRFRARGVLAKPFEAIVVELDVPYRVTPRAMRRSFQDVARQAAIHDVVTRSISGHATEEMQHHYSTAQAAEQRDALSKIAARLAVEKGEKRGEK